MGSPIIVDNQTTPSTKPMVWLLRIAIASLLLGVIGCALVVHMSVADLTAFVEKLAPDRVKGLPPEWFSELHDRFRLAAVVFLLTAAVLFGYRRKITRQYEALLLDRHRFRGTFTQSVRSCARDPWVMWPSLAIFVFGFIFRVIELSRPVRCDEADTYLEFARHPLYQALSNYSAPNNHLFHTMLVFFSTHLFGNTVIALRLPAFAGGLLMIPAAFALTSALYNRSAAIFASALVACSPPFVDYSANGRGYTWQCAFLLLMAWFACRIGRREDAQLDWLGFVLAAVGAVYTIPSCVVPCAAITLWLMLVRNPSGGVRGLVRVATRMTPVLISMLVLVTWLYLPPLVVSGPLSVLKNKTIQPLGMTSFLHGVPVLLSTTWTRWNDGLPFWAQALVILGFLAGLLAHRKIARYLVPLSPTIILLTAAFATARTILGYSRAWLYLWAFFLVTAGAGLAYVLSRRRIVAVCAILFAAAVGVTTYERHVFLWSTETGNVPDIATAATWADRNLDSQDRIVASDIAGPALRYVLHQRRSTLEPQMKFGPAPRRIIAVIAKQPEVDDGHATNPVFWQTQEVAPSTIMFANYDRQEYTEPRVVDDLLGVTIWEASRIPVESAPPQQSPPR